MAGLGIAVLCIAFASGVLAAQLFRRKKKKRQEIELDMEYLTTQEYES